jgi:hypothetical protein
MSTDMSKTADKLSDPISRQALIDAIQDSLNRHCQPWTPTPREKRAARPKIKKNPCHQKFRLDFSKLSGL